MSVWNTQNKNRKGLDGTLDPSKLDPETIKKIQESFSQFAKEQQRHQCCQGCIDLSTLNQPSFFGSAFSS